MIAFDGGMHCNTANVCNASNAVVIKRMGVRKKQKKVKEEEGRKGGACTVSWAPCGPFDGHSPGSRARAWVPGTPPKPNLNRFRCACHLRTTA